MEVLVSSRRVRGALCPAGGVTSRVCSSLVSAPSDEFVHLCRWLWQLPCTHAPLTTGSSRSKDQSSDDCELPVRWCGMAWSRVAGAVTGLMMLGGGGSGGAQTQKGGAPPG